MEQNSNETQPPSVAENLVRIIEDKMKALEQKIAPPVAPPPVAPVQDADRLLAEQRAMFEKEKEEIFGKSEAERQIIAIAQRQEVIDTEVFTQQMSKYVRIENGKPVYEVNGKSYNEKGEYWTADKVAELVLTNKPYLKKNPLKQGADINKKDTSETYDLKTMSISDYIKNREAIIKSLGG